MDWMANRPVQRHNLKIFIGLHGEKIERDRQMRIGQIQFESNLNSIEDRLESAKR